MFVLLIFSLVNTSFHPPLYSAKLSAGDVYAGSSLFVARYRVYAVTFGPVLNVYHTPRTVVLPEQLVGASWYEHISVSVLGAAIGSSWSHTVGVEAFEQRSLSVVMEQ